MQFENQEISTIVRQLKLFFCEGIDVRKIFTAAAMLMSSGTALAAGPKTVTTLAAACCGAIGCGNAVISCCF